MFAPTSFKQLIKQKRKGTMSTVAFTRVLFLKKYFEFNDILYVAYSASNKFSIEDLLLRTIAHLTFLFCLNAMLKLMYLMDQKHKNRKRIK